MKQLFFQYLKELRGNFLLFAAFLAIFAGVFRLYDNNWESYLYAAALCLALCLVVCTIRFLFYVKRHRERMHLLASLPQTSEPLPLVSTLAEADYQEMVTLLTSCCRESATAFETGRQDSLDYYTTWAHQIKTPIAVMQMILSGEDTDEHRALSAELFRIEQYVEMVLSYIRLDSPSNDFLFQEYALDTLIRKSIRKYAPQFIQKKIRLIYEPTDLPIITDEKWFCFLLEQLLSNAVKYTLAGTVTVSVSPDEVLSVSDTGIGIAAEDLPRIFEKGFTGYNGRADQKSTGLGLYLCKKTSDRLGIRIHAASTPGEGSTFFLDVSSHRLNVE
jgi:hypothetical protein